MGKKSWLQYSKQQTSLVAVFDLYPAVMSARVAVNPFAVHHLDLNGTVKPFTDEELELARNFNVKGALERAISERKMSELPVVF